MSASLKAHLALFTVALIYGANFTIAKIVLDDGYLHPVGFISLRIFAGALLFYIFHRLFIKERINRKDLPLLLVCALCGVVLNQLFFFIGLKETTPINASLIMTTTPILILIISAMLIGERVNSLKILGILAGAVGAILIISAGKTISFESAQTFGDFLVFINACVYGLYLVLVKKLMQKYHPITVIKWVFAIGCVIVLPFGTPYLLETNWDSFPTTVVFAVFYVLLFTTFFTYLLNALALQHVSASIVGIYIYLQPLIASTIALVLGNDELTSLKIFAAILIFLGVFLVSAPFSSTKE